jgi:hypothetical protein
MPRSNDVSIDLETLEELSRAELQALWLKLNAQAPPRCLGRDVLALGIAYIVQERRQRGLTKAVAREIDRILAQALQATSTGKGAGGRSAAGTLPRNGTVLVRQWQGATHHVTVVDDGFLWNGQTHRSLSGVAYAITGAKWNGPRFFGMRDGNGKVPEARP